MKRSKPTDSSRRDAKSAKIEATPSTGYLESLVSSNLQSSVLLSTRDKSSHLSLSKCQMTCIGCKVSNLIHRLNIRSIFYMLTYFL